MVIRCWFNLVGFKRVVLRCWFNLLVFRLCLCRFIVAWVFRILVLRGAFGWRLVLGC